MTTKYLKVLFKDKSGASDYKYKIDEVNETPLWNSNETTPEKMGGFNYSTETKILRWLVRGDTIYDVKIPIGAEIKECYSESAPHGVFRTNKIILKNPRSITDDLAMKYYKKSELPEKSYFKAMAGCAVRGHIKTATKIFEDKVTEENYVLAISEFEDFYKDYNQTFDETKLNKESKIIYNMFKDFIKKD